MHQPCSVPPSRCGSGRRVRVAGFSASSIALAWAPKRGWIACADFGGEIWWIRPDGSRFEKLGALPITTSGG